MSPCRSRARYESDFLRAALALAALPLVGCTWEAHSHEHEDPPPSFDLWELEPNDSHCCPNVVGTMFVGAQVVIGGHVQDDAFDPFDGFAFRNGEPLEVHFVLEPIGTWADLDLCVWDPSIGDFAFCFESPAAVESGLFTVPSSLQEFHLVVTSYTGDAEYRLTVWAEPISLGALAAPQNVPHKAGREIELRRYGPAEVEEPSAAPAVLDRGVALELDPDTGAVRQRALVVREDGIFLGPAR